MMHRHMQAPETDPAEPADEEIALGAYRIWLHDGCPQGKDREHWLKAREMLIAEKSREKSNMDKPLEDGPRQQPR